MRECIRVVNLSKHYHKHEVVKQINFSVEQGKSFAFLGPNGAGKSTTLNMICTLLKPSSGKIFIDGMDMDCDRERIKRKIGIVFQEDVLDDNLTIEQNLYFRGGLYIKNRKTLMEQIVKVAILLRMEPMMEQLYKECSGGQKRLVQVARALIGAPKLLILDEPTTGLDPVAREHVWSVLMKLKEELGITIFFTTHYMEEVTYADHVCVIDKGEILFNQRKTYAYYNFSPVYISLLKKGNRLWET